MARFGRSRERRDGSRDDSPRRDFRRGESHSDRNRTRGSSFEEHSRRRSSGRGRQDIEMTRVTCSSCGKECEVPFKPTSNKPVFCSDCFSKNGGKSRSGSRSGGLSNADLDIINEKLNKIMKALHIE